MGGEQIAGTGIADDWQINAMAGLDLSALIVLSLGVFAGLVWTWRSLDPTHPRSARLAILLLRSLALVSGFGLLLQPTLQIRKTKADPAQLAVLIDTSKSMINGENGGRIETVKKLIRDKAKELVRLQAKYKLRWYAFADELVALNGPEDFDTSTQNSKRTDIRKAVLGILNQRNGKKLDGLVIISDGADTELVKSKQDEWEISWAKRAGLPINTVAIGDSYQRRDLAIERVDVEPFAFSRGETPISVVLSSTGFADMETECFLWQDGSVVQRRKAKLFGGRTELVFTVFPKSLGTHVLTVTVPVPEGDEIPENNRVNISFEVTRDKIRVLHLAGRPSWDQRFLRQTLQSWPLIDLVSFYVLRTSYQSATSGASGMALIPFPTKELFEDHLGEFDVVIFHEFEPAAVNVDQYSEKIADFIRQGGAFVIIGGEQGLSRGMMGGDALPDLLPVVLLPANAEKRLRSDETPFRPRLTEGGSNHPLTRLKVDMDENSETWRSLPRLDGVGRIDGLAKGAHSLAEHIYLNVSNGLEPIVSVREVGKGRTLAITTDSLWRWRFTGPMGGGPSDVYETFWHRAISWLIRAPELERLRASVSPSPVLLGSPAGIHVEVLDEVYRPLSAVKISCTVSWIGSDGSSSEQTFEAQVDAHGRYHKEWWPKAEGPHRIVIKSEGGLTATRRFLVETDDRERGHLTPQPSLLEEIADATGGHFEKDTLTPRKLATAGASGNRVISQVDISLWDHPAALVLFIALLAAEWFLRRRMGLN